MRHFIRRNALRKKFSADSEQPLFLLVILRRTNQIDQGVVMQRSQLHHAQLLLKCPAPQFIGLAQSHFAAPCRIFAQGRAILFLEILQSPLPSRRGLHGLIPVSRATSTSESSVRLRYWFRILSAALCGFSRALRPVEKSLWIPSVAKTTASPCETGSTLACREGNLDPTTPARSRSGSCIFPPFASARSSTPCTLPTSSHVIIFCSGEMKARLSTAPRVPFSFS